jgi:hypothetical protein
MSFWRRLADARIEAAIAAGEFEGLHGEGRPLKLDKDPLSDPSMRLAHRVLKNADLAPHWVMIAREVQEEIAAVRRAIANAAPQCRDESDLARRTRARLLERVEALNTRIARFNLIVPHLALQVPALDGEREIDRRHPMEAEEKNRP